MQIAIVTGSSKGIGRATAELLSEKGFKVYGFSRTDPKSQLFETIVVDITDYEALNNAFSAVYKKEGRLDVLINNAGMGISGAAEFTAPNEIDKIYSLNAKAVANCCSIALPYLRESKGRIVNITSMAAVMAIPFQAFYSATKAFVAVYSEALRQEVRPFGVKVTTVLPGDTKTAFTQNREKNILGDEVYGERIRKSVEKMEADEKNGKPPISVAKVVLKVIKRKNPPVSVAVGGIYKLFRALKKFLPERLVNWILFKMYAN